MMRNQGIGRVAGAKRSVPRDLRPSLPGHAPLCPGHPTLRYTGPHAIRGYLSLSDLSWQNRLLDDFDER